jgi:hypothetical protein
MAVVQVRFSSASTSSAAALAFDINSGAFPNSAFAVYLCFKFFHEILRTYA